MADRQLGTLADLGVDIRLRRKKLGWTQAELAKEAAVAVTLVGRAERGQRVSDTTLRAIARTLHMPDEVITPHLAEPEPKATRPPVDPETGTWRDLRQELKYFRKRFQDTPEDFVRLLALLDLSDSLQQQDAATQGSAGDDA